MIRSLTGQLSNVDETTAVVDVGAMSIEILVPAADIQSLQQQLGQTVTLHTIFEIQGDPSRGNLAPTLIGFLRPEDRRFFNRFTEVPGIGTRKALKALNAPFADIASAIESGDTRFLVELPQIGKRLAETIVATLSGKLGAFVLDMQQRKPVGRLSNEDETAIAILSSPQMGLRRAEAEQLLERAKRALPGVTSADDLVPEMLKLHASR